MLKALIPKDRSRLHKHTISSGSKLYQSQLCCRWDNTGTQPISISISQSILQIIITTSNRANYNMRIEGINVTQAEILAEDVQITKKEVDY